MSGEDPLVSVCIPTFNRPSGLFRTLECITGQTYRNLEILIGDNCSDGKETLEVVKLFQNDRRIIYHRHDFNMGAVNNFKFLLSHTSGEYLMFASDDDEWYPNFIEKCLVPMMNDQSVFCSTSKAIIVSDTILRTKNQPDLDNCACETGKYNFPYWRDSEDLHTFSLPQIKRVKKYILSVGINVPTFGIYRTIFFKKHYLDPSHNPYRFGVDRFFIARMNLYGSVYQVPEYLFVYHHGLGDSCINPLRQYGDEIPRWEYYGLRIHPLLTAYLNMIIDSLSWPVSILDHIRVIGYYLARMVKAKILRYTMKTPVVGTPLYDYKPPVYPKRKDI